MSFDAAGCHVPRQRFTQLALDSGRTAPRRERKSLSAVVTESLAERRRLAALAEVVAWMSEGQPPLTAAELGAAQRELSSRQPKHDAKPKGRRAARKER